jgi:hypothetical protein
MKLRHRASSKLFVGWKRRSPGNDTNAIGSGNCRSLLPVICRDLLSRKHYTPSAAKFLFTKASGCGRAQPVKVV